MNNLRPATPNESEFLEPDADDLFENTEHSIQISQSPPLLNRIKFNNVPKEDPLETLRQLSRILSRKSSPDIDPEQRIAAEAKLFELQDNKSEKNSRSLSPAEVLEETPKARKTDPLLLPTPKVTGAYIETPAPSNHKTSHQRTVSASSRDGGGSDGQRIHSRRRLSDDDHPPKQSPRRITESYRSLQDAQERNKSKSNSATIPSKPSYEPEVRPAGDDSSKPLRPDLVTNNLNRKHRRWNSETKPTVMQKEEEEEEEEIGEEAPLVRTTSASSSEEERHVPLKIENPLPLRNTTNLELLAQKPMSNPPTRLELLAQKLSLKRKERAAVLGRATSVSSSENERGRRREVGLHRKSRESDFAIAKDLSPPSEEEGRGRPFEKIPEPMSLDLLKQTLRTNPKPGSREPDLDMAGPQSEVEDEPAPSPKDKYDKVLESVVKEPTRSGTPSLSPSGNEKRRTDSPHPENNRKPIPLVTSTAKLYSAAEDVRLLGVEAELDDQTLDNFAATLKQNAEASESSPVSDESIDDIVSNPAGMPLSKAERERRQEALYIQRMGKRILKTSSSIRQTTRGIERLEDQVSAIPVSVRGQQHNIQDSAIIAPKATTISITIPTLWTRTELSPGQGKPGSLWSRNWSFTWLGLIVFVAACWYVMESTMCAIYCKPINSSKNTWHYTDPEFPWALPTKLDQWTGSVLSTAALGAYEYIEDLIDPGASARREFALPDVPYGAKYWWAGKDHPGGIKYWPTPSTFDDDEIVYSNRASY